VSPTLSFSQSECFTGHDSYDEFENSTKNLNFVNYHLMNSHVNTDSDWPIGFREDFEMIFCRSAHFAKNVH
jgi:hypothetical protein